MILQNSKLQMPLVFTILLISHLIIISTATAQQPQNQDHQLGGASTANVHPFHASLSREFLDAHNKVRAHAGEPLFTWDNHLARYARRYASLRSQDCQMVHSSGPYGENIFWGATNHWTPTDAVRAWTHEHRFYDRTANTCESGRVCGHYTQIVWRDSTRLGCAYARCLNGGVFVVCTYDPPGNYVNERPFGDGSDGDN
ncbi:pathogenesis-related protein 1C [Malania oleifera]|uniref:pathogenesis-related protein 1C n=1 Tax=Malania oleifera TaxID=397392 RepID=UPI0025AECCE2|nr:pathogenesis-related protein 1C [Malania oleifera]